MTRYEKRGIGKITLWLLFVNLSWEVWLHSDSTGPHDHLQDLKKCSQFSNIYQEFLQWGILLIYLNF